jgi:hypothetical protein
VQSLKNTLQYSTVNNITNNSTVQLVSIVNNLSDVIPNDGYYPFYQRELDRLGYKRFIELVNKARAGSDTPAKLFCWMLKNDEVVR